MPKGSASRYRRGVPRYLRHSSPCCRGKPCGLRQQQLLIASLSLHPCTHCFLTSTSSSLLCMCYSVSIPQWSLFLELQVSEPSTGGRGQCIYIYVYIRICSVSKKYMGTHGQMYFREWKERLRFLRSLDLGQRTAAPQTMSNTDLTILMQCFYVPLSLSLQFI